MKSSLDEKSVQVDILVNNAGYGLHGEFLETPLERTTDGFGDRTGLHRQKAQHGRYGSSRRCIESRFGVPWAKTGNDHTLRTKFVVQCLSKSVHVRLSCCVSSIVGNRLESQETRDEKDLPGSAGCHVPPENIAQLGHRRDVELNHCASA